MKNIAVSVIIPIYNAEKFLNRSLGNLLNQTLENIEMICVNDGSTDNSLELLENYAKEDNRIKIVNKQNTGYGNSMNIGIRNATGEYIGILEPDDSADIHMFEDLYTLAKENEADFVKSNYIEYSVKDNKKVKYESLKGLPYNKVLTAEEYPSIFYVRPSVWSGIYRREFLIDNHILFNETPGASYQDTGFAFKVSACAKKIVLTEEAYLNYTIDNDTSSVKSAGKIFSVCDEMHSIESFLNQNIKLKKKFSKVLQSVKLDTYYWNFQRISDEYKDYFKDVIGLEFLKAEYDGVLDKEILGETRWEILKPFLEAFREKSELKNLQNKIDEIEKSYSYRIGSAIMAFPSKIKHMIKK